MHKKKIKYYHPSFFSSLFHKPLLFLFILFFLPFLVWGIQQTQQVTSFGKNIFPQASYGSIDPIEGYPGGPPPENHPDLNLAIRGYVPTTGEKYPIDLSNGLMGEKTPQIGKMLSGRPTIVSLYRIYAWDWTTGRKTVPMPEADDPAASVQQVSMIGLSTSAGEGVKVPPVYGNPISPEYNAMVIFANDDSITLKYTREDNIGINNGYAIQIENINVDPNLLSLYNQLDNSGRRELPAVSNEQVIGTAKGNEIRVVIRDTGDFLDPRSKLDWWQGVDYPPVPTDIVQNPTQTVQPTTVSRPTTAPTVRETIPTTPLFPTAIVTIGVTKTFTPTKSTSSVIIVEPTISTATPTSAPSLIVKLKADWDNFLTSIIKFTKVILP